MSAHFRDGKKFVDGREIPRVGFRESLSSNGVTIYTACAWADGTTSCNCTGWATSKTADKFGNPKAKACTHSKRVRPGDAVSLLVTERTFREPEARVEAPSPKKGRKIVLD
jgi:hypothetical protein